MARADAALPRTSTPSPACRPDATDARSAARVHQLASPRPGSDTSSQPCTGNSNRARSWAVLRCVAKTFVTFRDHVYNQRDELVFQNDKIALIRRRPAPA